MRTEFETALTEIKAMVATGEGMPEWASSLAEAIKWRASYLLKCRPELPTEDEIVEEDASVQDAEFAQMDFDMELVEFTREVWQLSTCQDNAIMAAFAEDTATGEPLFADDRYVAEYDDRNDKPFAIYPWSQIREELKAG